MVDLFGHWIRLREPLLVKGTEYPVSSSHLLFARNIRRALLTCYRLGISVELFSLVIGPETGGLVLVIGPESTASGELLHVIDSVLHSPDWTDCQYLVQSGRLDGLRKSSPSSP